VIGRLSKNKIRFSNSRGDMAPHSRGRICPSFARTLRPRKRRGRREGRVPADTRGPCAAGLRTNAQGDHRAARTSRPPLRSGLTAYDGLSPVSDALLPPSPCGSLMQRARSGRRITTGLDAQTPGARTTRFCRTHLAPVVCAPHAAHGVTRPATAFAPVRLASTASIPRFVTIATRPSDRDEIGETCDNSEFV
jgi:hypothetical protein